MAKLVDALDLGSSGATHRSSTLLTRTTNFTYRLCRLGKFSVPRSLGEVGQFVFARLALSHYGICPAQVYRFARTGQILAKIFAVY